MSCSKVVLRLDRVQETLDYEADVKNPEFQKVSKPIQLVFMISHSNIHYRK